MPLAVRFGGYNATERYRACKRSPSKLLRTIRCRHWTPTILPGTILYIEDNPSNLSLVESVLARYQNIKVFVAVRGAVGLEMAERYRPEVILYWTCIYPTFPVRKSCASSSSIRRPAGFPWS